MARLSRPAPDAADRRTAAAQAAEPLLCGGPRAPGRVVNAAAPAGDAALAAGHYLCRFGWDLSDQGDLRKAILSY
ncbi:hypothetical protein, partial [Streptomyces sp. S-9]|uniref:hypothetical protein n=1 Tax=Streptomyces sp. S-9 TaxID=2806600 RepID=UPI00193C1895